MVKIHADGADLETMKRLAAADGIAGLTTNPSLMRKAGITDYRAFAREVLAIAGGKAVSFEVLADDFDGMERQAREISSWGENVYVKIPITNTHGASSLPLVRRLSGDGVKVNVTAVLTLEQTIDAGLALLSEGIVSIFAGRIADTGVDPVGIVRRASMYGPRIAQILWASAREVFNVVQAEDAGADIITLPPELIAKLAMFGKDLGTYSLETVRQFYKDAEGITL